MTVSHWLGGLLRKLRKKEKHSRKRAMGEDGDGTNTSPHHKNEALSQTVPGSSSGSAAWTVVSRTDNVLDAIVRPDQGYVPEEVQEPKKHQYEHEHEQHEHKHEEKSKAPPNVTASIPFWRLFRPIPQQQQIQAHQGDGDMITTFRIASRHMSADPTTGRTVAVESNDICKSFRIDGHKDVVFKITFGLANGDSHRRRGGRR